MIELNEDKIERPFLCKTQDSGTYTELSVIFDHLRKPKMLSQLLHDFLSQRNEATNRSISCFAPKDETFSSTKSLEYRVSIPIGISSVGWNEYISRVLDGIGIEPTNQTEKFLNLMSKRKDYKAEYKKRKHVMMRRREKQRAIVMGQKKLDAQDRRNGTTYKSGVGVFGDEQQKISTASNKNNVEESSNKKSSTSRCSKCFLFEHSRSSHKNCRMNKASLDELSAEQKAQLVLELGVIKKSLTSTLS